ncbi:MAG: tetratricopeptide repeat protein [Candidatus Marinimicrobia bacterium]|nr:tetratricopeptide repeat protein [Candidatus Neomarinimicrobiota bacterium]
MKKIYYVFILVLLPLILMSAQENFFAKFGINLAAYFNTFYNAKVYFNDAQDRYNNEEDKEQLSVESRSALNKAASQAELVISKFPKSSYVDDAMFYNSVCQFQLGRYERALGNLEELTLQYPDSPFYFEAKLWISKCYFQMDKKTIAYNLIEQFLSNTNNRSYFSEAYSLMAYLALQENDKEKALNAFLQAADKASDKEPRCNMYLEAVEILVENERYEEALKYIDRANRNIKFDEQRARVQIAYIRIYRLIGDETKANELIAKALKDSRIAKYWGDIIYEQASIYFTDNDIPEAISHLRYIVDDPEKIYRNNRDSEAWARAAYRLGIYYIYEVDNIDSSEFFFKKAQTKRRQSEEGELASEYLKKIKQLKNLNKNLENILKKSPQLTDSAWVHYEYLADSTASEAMSREILLADTVNFDSLGVDSLVNLAKSNYHKYEVMLSTYLEEGNKYVGQLFSLAGLFLFDLNMPDTALDIYKKIEEEYYFTTSVPQALYSQSYVWEYELGDKIKADSIKKELTEKFPESQLTDIILDRVPQDSILFYENQEKIFEIERQYIDAGKYKEAVDTLRHMLRVADIDNKNRAFITYKIAWLYDYELSLVENTKDSTLRYYHMVVSEHPGTPFASKSALRISAIETNISEYFAYLAGDSLKTDNANLDSSLFAGRNEEDDMSGGEKSHHIKLRLKSPGKPRPIKL